MPKFEAAENTAERVGDRPKARYKFQPGRLKLSAADARQPLATASLHDQLVARLREMVLEGEVAPGTPLPEKMLCDTFGVSRTPLREAFKVLATEGLMELRPHRTPIVTPVDRDEIAAVFEVSIALDRLSAGLACARATLAERAALDALHADLAEHHRTGDRRAYFRRNQEIHAEIVRLAGNPVLTATWTSLSSKIRRARAQANYVGGRWEESFDEHEVFMAHFRRADSAAFAEAMATHTRMTAAAVLAGLDAAAPTGGAA